MAYSTIDKSTDHFNIKLYTGNTSGQSITGVGFQPDLLWIKSRSGAYNWAARDVLRGSTLNLRLNSTNADQTQSDSVTSFDSDGFTLGADSSSFVNENGATYCSWNWKAGGTGSSNYDGDTTSTVSANTTAGFSIVSWTGTGSAITLGHGLGTTPQVVLVKNRSEVYGWQMYHPGLGGNNKYISIDSSDAVATDTSSWNNTAPTASVFSVGASDANNKNGNNMIAYCFAEKPGYSKFGTYKGNGYADGTYVNVGFKPAIVILKRVDTGSSNWQLNDTARDNVNIAKKRLSPSTSDPEYTNLDMGDILSNGFKIKQTDQTWNNSSGTYLYLAFGQSLVGSNNIPTTAR